MTTLKRCVEFQNRRGNILFEKKESDPTTRLAFVLSLLEKTRSAIFEIREYWDKLLE
jgi:hypothetical protein